MKKITDFLFLNIPKKDLKITLSVIKKFKNCESVDEWLYISFIAWEKLEQLEEYLEYLVNNRKLDDSTIEYMRRK
jgi:hypothetical protein